MVIGVIYMNILTIENRNRIAKSLYKSGYSKLQVARMTNQGCTTISKLDLDVGDRFTSPVFDLKNDAVVANLKGVSLLDIETSPVSAHTFSIGRGAQTSYGNLHKNQEIKMLSVVVINLYDFFTRGINSAITLQAEVNEGYGVCDKQLCIDLKESLEGVSSIIAHNVSFDAGHINSRMLANDIKGWESKNKINTMSLFNGKTLLCKKLDYLMTIYFGINKLPTSMNDWASIVEISYPLTERKRAMEYMCEYNLVDVLLMLPLYLSFCSLAPNSIADMSIGGSKDNALCKVDGSVLSENGTYTNNTTGLSYQLYINKKLGTCYRNRLNLKSKNLNGVNVIGLGCVL